MPARFRGPSREKFFAFSSGTTYRRPPDARLMQATASAGAIRSGSRLRPLWSTADEQSQLFWSAATRRRYSLGVRTKAATSRRTPEIAPDPAVRTAIAEAPIARREG